MKIAVELVLFVCLACGLVMADEIDDAQALLGTDKHADGVAAMRAAIAKLEKKPDDAHASLRAGVGYFHLEEDAKSEKAIRCAIALAPKNALHHYWLGVLLQYSDTGKAEASLRKAVELDAKSVQYLVELGEVQRRSKQTARALATYRKVLVLDPKHAVAHMRVGNLLHSLKKVDKSVKHWERALELDGSLLLARYNVGLAHYKAGRFGKALVHWEEGTRQAPDDFDMHKKVIQALHALGRHGETAAVRTKLLALRAKMEKPPKEFCFDQFMAGPLKVMAFERFDVTGDLAYRYVFRVVKDGKVIRRVNLERSTVLEELGRAFILGKTEADGSHATWGLTWKKLPDYKVLRRLVIDAADGDIEGVSSASTAKK